MTYQVLVERDERFWRVRVPAVERTTMALSLGEVEVMARDLIAVMTDEPVDALELEVHIDLPTRARHHLEEAARLRDVAATTNRQAAAEARAAAAALRADGLTVRDIGHALGISYQRAHQLIAESDMSVAS